MACRRRQHPFGLWASAGEAMPCATAVMVGRRVRGPYACAWDLTWNAAGDALWTVNNCNEPPLWRLSGGARLVP